MISKKLSKQRLLVSIVIRAHLHDVCCGAVRIWKLEDRRKIARELNRACAHACPIDRGDSRAPCELVYAEQGGSVDRAFLLSRGVNGTGFEKMPWLHVSGRKRWLASVFCVKILTLQEIRAKNLLGIQFWSFGVTPTGPEAWPKACIVRLLYNNITSYNILNHVMINMLFAYSLVWPCRDECVMN